MKGTNNPEISSAGESLVLKSSLGCRFNPCVGNLLVFGFDDPCWFLSAPNILLFCNTMIMNNNSKLHYACGSVASLITLIPCWL